MRVTHLLPQTQILTDLIRVMQILTHQHMLTVQVVMHMALGIQLLIIQVIYMEAVLQLLIRTMAPQLMLLSKTKVQKYREWLKFQTKQNGDGMMNISKTTL